MQFAGNNCEPWKCHIIRHAECALLMMDVVSGFEVALQRPVVERLCGYALSPEGAIGGIGALEVVSGFEDRLAAYLGIIIDHQVITPGRLAKERRSRDVGRHLLGAVEPQGGLRAVFLRG